MAFKLDTTEQERAEHTETVKLINLLPVGSVLTREYNGMEDEAFWELTITDNTWRAFSLYALMRMIPATYFIHIP